MDVVATQPNRRRARTYASAWLVLLVGLGFSAGTAGWLWREAEAADRMRFNTAVSSLLEQFDTRTERYVTELERIADRLAGQTVVSDAFWRELVDRMNPRSNFPALLELAYATNAALSSRAEVAAELEARKNSRGQSKLADIGPPTLRVSHRWQSTRINGQETEGWLSSPLVQGREGFAAGGRVASTLRRLVPATGSNQLASVGLLVPVFAADVAELRELYRPTAPASLRQHRLAGMLVGTLGWQAFLTSAMSGTTGEVAFEAFAGTNVTAETWLKESQSASPRVLAADFRPRFRLTKSWPFYSRRWWFVFYSTDSFERQSPRFRAWVALGGGGLLTFMVALLVAAEIRARLRQEGIAGQLRAALDEVESARRERERLSHDLHDGTIQSLYALQLGLSRAGEQALESAPAVGARLADYRRNLTAIIGELRGYILRHEADESPQGNLAGVLTALLERLHGTTETELRADISGPAARRLAGEQAVHLANLTREALSNALRHAHARCITVTLRDDPQRVTLEVADDGCGFYPAQPPHTGLGLTSMATRAREAGGELHVESKAGEGTRVRVIVRVDGRQIAEQ